MDQPIFAVLLAGRIRSTPLIDAISVPALCLPLGERGTLLDAWLSKLCGLPQLNGVQAVVNFSEEVRAVQTMARHACAQKLKTGRIEVLAEPSPWRGAGGILRDVTERLPHEALILVCEAKRLPPEQIGDILNIAEANANNFAGIIGVCGNDQPAGVSLFTRAAIERIPAIGYFDLKEQFLPLLRRSGDRVLMAGLGDCVCRIHDLESYLACVRQSLVSRRDGAPRCRVSTQASISPSAILEGCCVVEAGAVVEDGAVVHDSVVLWGATIGGGAVVSRSLVGPLATVRPRQRLAGDVIARAAEWDDSPADRSHWIRNVERIFS